MKPTVAELKAHVRVDISNEDTLLEGMIDAAYQSAASYTRVDFATVYPTELPAGIKVAVLMLAGSMYAQREATAINTQIEVPIGYKMLLAPYRTFSDDS